MHPKVQEKIAEWLQETFLQVGEFCEVSLDVDLESLAYETKDWPNEAIQNNEILAAAQRVRDGDANQTSGITIDRNLAIYLACNLMMLLPAATADRMKGEPGPLDEDDLESLGEIGNLLTGVINQLPVSEEDEVMQLEFVGIHSSVQDPADGAYASGLHAFSAKVKADKYTFDITLYLIDDVLQNWCKEQFETPLEDESEEAESDAESTEGAGGSADADGMIGSAGPHTGPGGAQNFSSMGPGGPVGSMGGGFQPMGGPRSGSMGGANASAQAIHSYAGITVPNSYPWIFVDGSARDLAHLREFMGASGLYMFNVSSAHDAIEVIKSHWVEGIFIDIELSDEEGLVLLKRLRSNFLTSDLPVIITANEPTRAQVMEAIRCGATHFLVKPLTEESIKAAFTQTLRRHPRLRSKLKAAEGAEAA